MDPKIKITRVEAGQDANASVFVVIDNAIIGSVLSLEGPIDDPVFIIKEDGSATVAKNIDVLEERMELAQRASSLILGLRKKEKIKVRQPLQKILIPVLEEGLKEKLQKVEELILTEVNVKEIEFITDLF